MADLFEIMSKRRGITPQFMADIENDNYPDLMDIDKLAEHLHNIYLNKDRIVIIPDFDMDGIMSGTTAYAGFAQLGFNVALYLPDPSQGYGFTTKDIDNILTIHPDVKALITCDVGITAFEAIDYAKRQDLTVLVTDHHKEPELVDQPQGFIRADVIVDPQRLDETYPHPAICGAFVMWQVLDYYARAYQPHNRSLIKYLRLFAGIGTVSDMMDVKWENRALLRDSISIARLLLPVKRTVTDPNTGNLIEVSDDSVLLGILNDTPNVHPVYLDAFIGFSKVLLKFQDMDKLRVKDGAEALDEGFYGFYLAPTFNAVKRMDGSMEDTFGAFFNHNNPNHIDTIYELNEERKEIVKKYVAQALEDHYGLAPYVYIIDAPAGVLGLIANKIMSDYTRLPVAVLNKETFTGSGRAPSPYPLHTRGNQNGFTIAGHEQANGVQLDSLEKARDFAAWLEQDFEQFTKEYDGPIGVGEDDLILSDGFSNKSADAIINPKEIIDFVHAVNNLKPFGHGFPYPSTLVTVSVNDLSYRVMGSDDQHVKFTHPYGLDLISWNSNSEDHSILDDISDIDTVNFRGKLQINEFNGRTYAQMIIDTYSKEN